MENDCGHEIPPIGHRVFRQKDNNFRRIFRNLDSMRLHNVLGTCFVTVMYSKLDILLGIDKIFDVSNTSYYVKVENGATLSGHGK